MIGKPIEIIRETRRAKTARGRPAGVRATVVAMKRVTTVEPRVAGKWIRNEPEQRTETGDSGGNAYASWRSPGPMVMGGT